MIDVKTDGWRQYIKERETTSIRDKWQPQKTENKISNRLVDDSTMSGRPMSEVVYRQYTSGRPDNRTILKSSSP